VPSLPVNIMVMPTPGNAFLGVNVASAVDSCGEHEGMKLLLCESALLHGLTQAWLTRNANSTLLSLTPLFLLPFQSKLTV
jgi:hypothetical protein